MKAIWWGLVQPGMVGKFGNTLAVFVVQEIVVVIHVAAAVVIVVVVVVNVAVAVVVKLHVSRLLQRSNKPQPLQQVKQPRQ